MPDKKPDDEDETKREPTQKEALQISAAGAEAITKAETPEDAEKDAAEAIEKKADELGVNVSPEAAQMIAEKTVETLRTHGAIPSPAQPAFEPPAEDHAGEDDGDSDQEDDGDDNPDEVDVAPRKTSFAGRYLKSKGDN